MGDRGIQDTTAVENLQRRFPSLARQIIENALTKSSGHAGNAAKRLRCRVSEESIAGPSDRPCTPPLRLSEPMNDGEVEASTAVKNLQQRFPSLDRQLIVSALMKSLGHAGNAAKQLRRQHADVGETAGPSARTCTQLCLAEPFWHRHEAAEVNVKATVTATRGSSVAHELEFRKFVDADSDSMRFDLVKVDGELAGKRVRYSESMFSGAYFSFGYGIDQHSGSGVLDILRLYTRDLRRDHPGTDLHGESIIAWLKTVASASGSVLKVCSTEDSIRFYEKYMAHHGGCSFSWAAPA